MVTIEYSGLWHDDDLELMSMDNMVFGTYQFMRNMKSMLEHEHDLRSTFWQSWIGVNHRSFEAQELIGTKVVQVLSGTPADGVLQAGDIITRVNGRPITSYDDLEITITELGPGHSVTINAVRELQDMTVMLQTVPYGSNGAK